jgi:hypothetical protein
MCGVLKSYLKISLKTDNIRLDSFLFLENSMKTLVIKDAGFVYESLRIETNRVI